MNGIKSFLAHLFEGCLGILLYPAWLRYQRLEHSALSRPVDQEQYLFLDANLRPVGEKALVEAASDLVAYRYAAGPLNFQLEKADTFIFRMRIALEEMGEGTAVTVETENK